MLPLVGCDPLKVPPVALEVLAMHEVAYVAVQFSVTLWPK
jgi:hypothetical protein